MASALKCMDMWRWIRKRRWAVAALVVLACALCACAAARVWMHLNARHRVFVDASSVAKCRVALVLGAGVKPDGTCSQLLRDRLDRSVELYKAGRVEKLLMSGDNRVSHYNEPERMRDYAISQGVPAEDVKCDYAGRRTYDSIYRARHVFGLRKVTLTSQGFHLPRALFLCDAIGVKACGLAADQHVNLKAELREYVASVGALFDVYIRHPKPVMGKRESI